MEMTAVIQYILTSARSFGSQDYYNNSLMTILGIASLLFCENEETQTKRIIVCSEENTYGKRVTTLLSLYPHSFLLLSVSFS